jgi:hypothetical protein
MKKLIFIFILILLARPVFAFSYAEELTNNNETYNLITSISYEGNNYFLYGIYQNNQMSLIVLQDSLNNLVTDNKTIKDVFYIYRSSILASEKDFNLLVNRIQEKKNYVNEEINEIENITPQYQSLILNLSSQGAYASKSIELFSDLQNLIWQAKMLLSQNKFNSADKAIEDAKNLVPKITLDIRSSFRVNEGSLALEKILSEINDARKQGYDTKNIENDFDNANSLLTEAKNSYMNEDYNNIDSKIASVLDTSNKISYEIENLNVSNSQVQVQNVSTTQPTGLMIGNYSWFSYVIGIIVIAVIIFKISKRKKELRGISKLVRIKSRLE